MKMAFSLFIILVASAIFLPLPVHAEYQVDRRAWTGTDTLLEVLFGTLVYLDWKQTIEFTQNPQTYPDCHETNVFIGSHPTRRRINAVIGTSLLGHALIAYELPQPYRAWWQIVWIGIEGDVVHTNYVVTGVAIKF